MYLCITSSLKITEIALILKEHIVSQCADDIIWELDIFRSPDSEVYPAVFSIICQMKFSAIYLLVPFSCPFPNLKSSGLEPYNPKDYVSNLPFLYPLQHHTTFLEFNIFKILNIPRSGFCIKY